MQSIEHRARVFMVTFAYRSFTQSNAKPNIIMLYCSLIAHYATRNVSMTSPQPFDFNFICIKNVAIACNEYGMSLLGGSDHKCIAIRSDDLLALSSTINQCAHSVITKTCVFILRYKLNRCTAASCTM